MRFIVAIAAAALFVSSPVLAERVTDLNTGRHAQVLPHKNRAAALAGSTGGNVAYHNGPVLHQAKVVPIFWGPSATWGTNGATSPLAWNVLMYLILFGTTPQYNVITQYY